MVQLGFTTLGGEISSYWTRGFLYPIIRLNEAVAQNGGKEPHFVGML